MDSTKNDAHSRGMGSAKVIRVIETKTLRGAGTRHDVDRIVTQYWDFKGNLLAEYDPCVNENKD